MFEEAFHHGGKGKNKHARVPTVIAGIQIFYCPFEPGFFHKPLRNMNSCFVCLAIFGGWEWGAGLNVTIPCFRPGGFNADRENSLPT